MALYTLGPVGSNIIIKEIVVSGKPTTYTYIPQNDSLPDYREYLKWLADGNTPDAAPPPPSVYKNSRELAASVLTLNATPTELFRVTLAPGNLYVADYFIMAIQRGSPYNSLYGRWMQGVKAVSTTAALVGTQQPLIPPQGDAPAAGLAVTPSVSGLDFIITVTGLASIQIRWILRGEYVRGSPVDFGGLTG
jgi:hypothetical protein